MGAILGQSGPKRWIPGAPSGVQGIREKGTPSIWGEVRGHPRVYLGCTVPPVPKYTLRMAADLAPYGWGALFSNTFAPHWALHRLGPLLPQMAKNHAKRGTPLFGHFFRKVAEIQTPFSKKSADFPPAEPSFGGGGGNRTFFRKSAKTRFGFLLPLQNRVF